MENDQFQSNNLFTLNVDNPIKSYLGETAKWGRFLAILGLVVCGLMVLGGLIMVTTFSNTPAGQSYDANGNANPFFAAGPYLLIFYILFAVLYFFPCLYLLRFSNKMKLALVADDQEMLTESFRNLKALFRYVGILTLIILAFYALAIVFSLIAAATTG